MKKHLQRIFLTALILLGGANGAWAAQGDVTVNADIDFSNAIENMSVQGTVGSMAWTQQWTVTPYITDGVLYYGNTNGAAVTLQNNNIGTKDQVTIKFDLAFGKLSGKHVGFHLEDADGNNLLQQWFDAYNGDFDDANPLNLDWNKMYRGSNPVIWERKVEFTIVLNYATKKITTSTTCLMSGTSKPATTGEFVGDWTATAPIAKFVLDGNINNADRVHAFDNLKITTTEGDYTAATANYTVKYVCDGNEIKDAVTYSGDVNAAATIAATDKANFSVGDDARYIYVSDDAAEKTIAADGSTVVTVTFREAEKWSYTIGSTFNASPLTYTATGSVWEDLNNVTVSYPRFQLSGTQLVEKAPLSNNLQQAFTVTADNFTDALAYNAVEGKDNVCLLAEAEALETTLSKSATSFTSRVSNGQIIYGSEGTLLTLPAGKYIFTLGAIGGDNTNHKVSYCVKAGETTIAEGLCTGNFLTLLTGEEFTLNEATPITFTCSDPSSARGIDLIYVQKTGDVEAPATETVVTGYTVDFNTAITTSNHSFKVASNWKHIVGTYTNYWDEEAYPSYSYSETAGVDGSGALSCSTNQNSNSIYDLLVTPVVKGTVTIAAKATASYYTPQLSFYKIVEDENGTLTRGDQITVDVSAVNATDFTTITIPVDEAGQRIGIRSSYVWLDNFAAEEAIIIPEKSILIASADPTATTGTIYWNQQANGKVLVKYTVTVTNNGDVALTQGTEGYSVSVVNRSTGDVYATAAVPQDLAVGATSNPFDVTGEVETTLWPNSYTYINMDLKENLQGSTLERAQSHYRAYESKFVFRAAESTATSSLTAESWGTISESTTKQYEIANTGTAPMTITAITLPEGFTSTDAPTIPAEGLVVEGGQKVTLSITNDATATGTFSGTLTVSYIPALAAGPTDYTLPFTAVVIGANTWTADFNNTTSTVAYPAGAVAESGIDRDYQFVSSGNYNNWLIGRNSDSYASENNKFITPKLHANAGDQLTFDVKAGYSSTNNYYVKVYVSADRTNWGDPVAYYTYTDDAEKASVGVGSSFVTKTVTMADEGDYYVAFALYGNGSGIDNIVGLEKVAVAHDLYIKSVSWPDASIKSGTAQTKPSVDIIPLTDETADAYTVKYVYGDNEVTIASKALTASATSSTNFAAAFTPEVEQTTTFPGTKVVFEFTDGTTFETEEFELTVTNEAIFHFLNTKYTSRWYEPSSDYTTPYSFGKTNVSGASKTFWILNWGSAPLTVKSIAVPQGFTASVENMSLPAFDGTQDGLETCQQSFDVTFSATEPGDYSGNMVITYVNGQGEDATFELALSGTMLDPAKFYANFGAESNQWPAGSVYQRNVSTTYVTTGDYAITSSSTTDNLFITPKLTAADGDKLLFDAKLYSTSWSEGKVVVYAAATRDELVNFDAEADTRTPLLTVSGQDETNPMTTDYQTFEVPAVAGDNYYAFEISGRPYVDEIYGLKVADVAHDLAIASTSIPAEAMQNVASTATVSVLNLGLADEAADAYTATLYVDGEPAATAETVALPMAHQLNAAGTQLSFSFRSPKAGTFPVYIEVKAGDYSVQTEPVNVTFTEEVAVADAIEVGTKTSSDRDHAIIDFYNLDNSAKTSDILYTAAQLNAFGITAGSKITKLAFMGSISSAKTISNSLTAWYALSTGDITPNSPDKTAMTEVTIFDGSIPFAAGVNEIAITLAEPLVYDGTSDLRIYFEGTKGGWASVLFDYDTNYMNMYWGGNSTAKANPLLYVTLAAEPATIAGTVNDEAGAPIENATVTLVSNDGDNVQYTGTTDAEGAYSFNVIQTSRTYTATVTAAGYDELVEEGISFANGSVTKNFVMTAEGGDSDALLAQYFVNTDLSSTEGWTPVVSSQYRDYGNGKIGEYQVYIAPSTADDTHLSSEYCFGMECRWSTNYAAFTQESKSELPAGQYTLTFDVENVNAATTAATYDNRFTVTVGDKVFTDQSTEWMQGKSSWTAHSITFDVPTDSKVTISFGYGTGTNNIGSSNTPALYVSHLGLAYKSPAVAASEALQAEIAKAESLKTDTRTEGLTDFEAAITAAKALLTSTDAAAITAAVEALQQAEETFLTANLPIAEGTYYLYNPLTDKFLSRGNAWGTSAVVDNYGVAVKVAVTSLEDGKYTLTSFDNNITYGDDAWMFADASGDRARTFNINKVEDGSYTLTNTTNNMLMYVYLKEDGNKFRVAGNAIKNDNYTDDAQTVWQFLTPEQRDAYVAIDENEAKNAAFEQAGIAIDADLAVADATVMNFGANHGWTQTIVRTQDGQPANEGTVTEMWQATGSFAKTVSNLSEGLYKVSIQAFYRNGNADEDQARVATGLNTVQAYLDANGTRLQVKSWTSDKGDGNDPNNRTQAQAKFAESKYLTEGYAYVGSDGKLSLTINNPAHIGNGWFIVGTVSYAQVTENILAGDITGDGQVTTGDAVGVIDFVLEKSEPTEAEFKAADVNKDQLLTISDAVGIVSIALGDWDGTLAAGARQMESFDYSGNYITLRGNEVGLVNNTRFTAFQMDVTLSEGAQLNGAQLTQRTIGHQVAWNRVGQHTWRIVVFSTGNDAISAADGALLTLDISGDQHVTITHNEFTDQQARGYQLGLSQPTGIHGIYADDADTRIFNAAGQQNDKLRKGMNIVVDRSGKTVKVLRK